MKSVLVSQRMDCLFIGAVEGKVWTLNPISLSFSNPTLYPVDPKKEETPLRTGSTVGTGNRNYAGLEGFLCPSSKCHKA